MILFLKISNKDPILEKLLDTCQHRVCLSFKGLENVNITLLGWSCWLNFYIPSKSWWKNVCGAGEGSNKQRQSGSVQLQQRTKFTRTYRHVLLTRFFVIIFFFFERIFAIFLRFRNNLWENNAGNILKNIVFAVKRFQIGWICTQIGFFNVTSYNNTPPYHWSNKFELIEALKHVSNPEFV